ncbi:hypothetical protein MMC29_000804 [Sticta canariensis]|nr:hypothetical protein [Sticta canariensis]
MSESIVSNVIVQTPSTPPVKLYNFTILLTAPTTPSALQAIQKRILDLTDHTSEEFESPISRKREQDIDPHSQDTMDHRREAHENPWISARNQTAHKITIEEARASAARQGKDSDFLSQWVNLMAIHEQNTRKSLDEVAFKERLVLTTEGSLNPVTDLPSVMAMMKASEESDLEKFFLISFL